MKHVHSFALVSKKGFADWEGELGCIYVFQCQKCGKVQKRASWQGKFTTRRGQRVHALNIQEE